MANRTKAALVAATFLLGAMLPLEANRAIAAEQPVASERNPPGDIPDSQVFIAYAGPGFSLLVPEGWSRNDSPGGASFSDKYNRLEITSTQNATAPSIASVTANEATKLAATGRAITIDKITEATLTGGPAIRIDYQSNSTPNVVTGKQIRLENARYFYFKAGKLVTLDMAAPAGADNVDQWLLMANSVRLD